MHVQIRGRRYKVFSDLTDGFNIHKKRKEDSDDSTTASPSTTKKIKYNLNTMLEQDTRLKKNMKTIKSLSSIEDECEDARNLVKKDLSNLYKTKGIDDLMDIMNRFVSYDFVDKNITTEIKNVSFDSAIKRVERILLDCKKFIEDNLDHKKKYLNVLTETDKIFYKDN